FNKPVAHAAGPSRSRGAPLHPALLTTPSLTHYPGGKNSGAFLRLQIVRFWISWRGNFVGKIGWRQKPKIFHIERIDAIGVHLLGAAQVDSLINPASSPTTDGTVVNHLLIFLRG